MSSVVGRTTSCTADLGAARGGCGLISRARGVRREGDQLTADPGMPALELAAKTGS
jgi:hypothetical protein